MNEPDDDVLLREYIERDSEAAFAALITRHVNKVYSIALRHTRSPHQAEEITQAVFVILARKSRVLPKAVILSGWLCRTAHLAARTFLRSEQRRTHREQEAYMQNTARVGQSEAWPHIAPLLDTAMASLSESDHHAVVLRFYDGKSMKEVGTALGATEGAAKKRVNRAVERLRKFFSNRGMALPATVLTAVMAANSVQAAPEALAKTVTAIAIAKGTSASTSTLTIIKGALKIMAWTQMKTAVVAGASILLVAGTGIMTVKEIQNHQTWQVPKASRDIIRNTTPQVAIVPTKFAQDGGKWKDYTVGGGAMGIAQTITDIVNVAYNSDNYRTIFPTNVPEGRYDFFVKLTDPRAPWDKALQAELKSKLGVNAMVEVHDTDVLLLKVQVPNAPGLNPPGSLRRQLNLRPDSHGYYGINHYSQYSYPVSLLAHYLSLKDMLDIPVVDQTGLTNKYDFVLEWDAWQNHPNKEGLKQAVLDQLGLKLVPDNMPTKCLVVKSVR